MLSIASAPIRAFCCLCIISLLASYPCAASARAESPTGSDTLRHGWNWGFSVQHSAYYASRPLGVAAEGAFQADVAIGLFRGTLSVGFQPAYAPNMGRWDELPYNIGHLKQLNLHTPAGTIPSMGIGNQTVNAGDIFLIDRGSVPFNLSGFLSLSPSGAVVLEYDEYKVTAMRTSMWGLTLPVRMHFGRDKPNRVRPFADMGLGFDMVRTTAEYEVFSDVITYSYLEGELDLIRERRTYEEPMKGEASQHLLFTRAHLGVGARFRKFGIGVRAQRSIAKDLTYRGATYQRVRGNVLAMPFLAGASEDADLAQEVQDNGIAIYARSGLAKKEATDGSASSEGLYGLSRFWDRTTWLLSLTFWLRS